MRSSGCSIVSAAALTAAVSLSAGTAFAEDAVRPYPACDRKASDAEVSAAQGAFQAGNGSFNEGDYPKAIEYWEDAYHRDCTAHRMLLNLARAYESSGQRRHAVNALRTYLARSPGTPDAPQIQKRIDNLEEQIKAEPAATVPRTETTAPPHEESKPVVAPPADNAKPPSPPPEQPAEPTASRPILPLVVAGVGGAVFIVGGLVYLGAWSKIHSAENDCPTHTLCAPDVVSRGNSARTQAHVSGAFAIGGLAVLGGGLVWYFVSKPEQRTAHASSFTAGLAPEAGYGYGGVSLTGAF